MISLAMTIHIITNKITDHLETSNKCHLNRDSKYIMFHKLKFRWQENGS